MTGEWPAHGTPVLEAREVTLRAGAATLVDGVSLRVSAGEVLVLLGENGAGKSSLLRLLSGEARPASGQVRLLGRDLATYPLGALACLRAVLLQETYLPASFTAAEVVRLGRHPHAGRGPAGRSDPERVHAALAEVEATHLHDRLYPTLSGGEKRRVQLARTLVQLDGPGLLLVDEPTAGLDLRHQVLGLRLLRRQADRGAAVVAILHDLALAAQVATRVQVLRRGRTLAEGTPAEVLDAALARSVFGVETHTLEAGVRGPPRLVIPRL